MVDRALFVGSVGFLWRSLHQFEGQTVFGRLLYRSVWRDSAPLDLGPIDLTQGQTADSSLCPPVVAFVAFGAVVMSSNQLSILGAESSVPSLTILELCLPVRL